MNLVLHDSAFILLAAFALDVLLGDPVYPLHPVRLIGQLITVIEKGLEKLDLFNHVGGVLLVLLVLSVTLGAYSGGLILTQKLSWIFNIFLVYSCIAFKDLLKHGKVVARALEEQDLEGAQMAVQMLIGRDAKLLDADGIKRATIESLAENFIDGLLAPVFWFAVGSLMASLLGFESDIGGVGAILVYRVTNTLDSMVGYRNDRYQSFGWASARLDDVLNFFPARLGIPVITLGAIWGRFHAKAAWKTGWRDRLKHSSPNAGHAEASVAGALNIKLGGPGIYPHGKVEKPWLGDGSAEVPVACMYSASRLITYSAIITIAILILLQMVRLSSWMG